ncbi:E3 ubiquitin-protein ligase sina isoform X2 [Cryptotermes secundus]|uniref:E3 ubiquitin-protein ligase sina isoform X2 n=1 Tax=Cryptotermes secundus TaxID=105785 RepID=UPI000CD7D0DC|nr:E3 ubiquitin-protein ligase sina isoform X2 [Cryptotermes secundus]
MAEDEAFPAEASQISKSVQDALECPVCLEYMTPPITMCSSGHSVCQACRPRMTSCPTCRRPLLGIRNYALELLARELQLPPRPADAPQATCLDTCPYEPEVIFAFGKVFLYQQRLHTIKRVFYIVVQYVGPEEEASRFKYEVELRSGSGAQKMTVIGNVTLHYYQDINAVYEAGNCVTLDYDVVKNVAEDKLIYSVKVFKPSISVV